ncbi:MAG: response regulator, partial [Deltaproteobacteria bacterium]|nr:response regulator [Deltaproteobacteria bacterium]
SAVLINWEDRPATLNFVRDITAHKKLEDQLLHAQKMEAIGTLAGGVAHDFNNLLQAVQGYADLLLLDQKEGDRGYREVQEIRRAGQKAAGLTRQLLTFGRKVESKLRPLDLNAVVKQASALLERTIPKMIDIELHLSEDMMPVHGDPGQIEQILMNLGINARDAMPEGGRVVIETGEVSLDDFYCEGHLGAKAGRYACVRFSDTGCGMDRDTLTHIFEPFYTTKETGTGTGLGLAMVYGIVKSHNGYIMCYSEPGKGTTFKIYLPAIAREAEPESRKEDAAPPGGTETILLVDDEEYIRSLGAEILSRFGYSVLQAPDGESALEIYRKEGESIDLIILDLIMPGMGGKRCLEKILEVDPEAAVLISSGHSINGPTRETIESGAKGFIAKPYQVTDMLQSVYDVLRRQARAPSGDPRTGRPP